MTTALPSTPCPPPQDLLDDMLYEPGPYLLRIHAADVRGNEALANRDLRVMVDEPCSECDAGAVPEAPLKRRPYDRHR